MNGKMLAMSEARKMGATGVWVEVSEKYGTVDVEVEGLDVAEREVLAQRLQKRTPLSVYVMVMERNCP